MSLFASLTNRIFAATALLAVLAIAVAVYRINVAVTVQAENELRRGLVEAGRLLEEHRTTLFEHFAREARLIADLSHLKAAMDTRHPPTVEPIARDYQQRIGADLFIVADAEGRLLAEAGRIRVPALKGAVAETMRRAASGGEAVALWPYDAGVLQVAAVPSFIGPELVGTLAVGTSLDQQALADYRALTNSEIAFALDGGVLISTLAPEFNPQLAPLIGRAEIGTVALGDEVYEALSRPLALVVPGADGSARDPTDSRARGADRLLPRSDDGGRVTALILRSRTERLRFLRAVHRELAVTAILAVLAATLLSYGIARTITRPLGAITATMRDMAATGDLTRRIPDRPAGGWQDEDARLLATTFNTLTDSIARFQREASQKERLSSLGRLSTVVAHEIRNPLMIIKTAVRVLKAPGATPDQVRAAAADIDEEVARLNHIVAEVLDFAKPIRFELAPADLNAVCEAASRAVESGSAEPAIRLELDAGVRAVTTDAERLRQALVNILANAQHAVSAARAGAASSSSRGMPAITLVTTGLHPGRVRITVRDRGCGIPAQDLPRIFDPFFTTRRTGTGLGLAISRNIIEALGGTIAIRSKEGSGTEVIIELTQSVP